jgi:opine dehydrogenase
LVIKINKPEKTRWAVLGGGNGGQSLSGHLSLMGFPVKLYDIFPDTIEAINAKGGIKVDGVVEGFGSLELATTNISEAIDGAEVVMVVAPALAHREIGKKCAPHLVDGQVVFLHPGATFGALEFRKILDDENYLESGVVAPVQMFSLGAIFSDPVNVYPVVPYDVHTSTIGEAFVTIPDDVLIPLYI